MGFRGYIKSSLQSFTGSLKNIWEGMKTGPLKRIFEAATDRKNASSSRLRDLYFVAAAAGPLTMLTAGATIAVTLSDFSTVPLNPYAAGVSGVALGAIFNLSRADKPFFPPKSNDDRRVCEAITSFYMRLVP